MKISTASLVIAFALVFLGNLTGCAEPSTKVTPLEPIFEVGTGTSGPEVSVRETINVSDLTQLSPLLEVATPTLSPLLPTSLEITETVVVTDSQELTLQTPPPQVLEVTVTVTSPKAGVTWRVGTLNGIGWMASPGQEIAYINIYYSTDGGKSFRTVIEKQINNGNFPWTVPDTPSENSLIRVIAVNAKGENVALGDSGIFTIDPLQQAPPPVQVTVTVISPKAGEVWHTGTTQNIIWTTTGQGIDHVDIYFSTDAGKSMISIAQKEPDDGVFAWKVPSASSKTVLVRVLAYNTNGQTLASGDSGLFTISLQ
jgi:hypothetical protein